jgi:hypothetical protein
VEKGFEMMTADQGQTILVRVSGTVSLAAPDINDPAPITIVLYPEANPDGSYPTDVVLTISTIKEKNNRGIWGRYGGDQYYVAADTITMSTVHSWIRLESCGGPNDPFWLITGGAQRGASEQ